MRDVNLNILIVDTHIDRHDLLLKLTKSVFEECTIDIRSSYETCLEGTDYELVLIHLGNEEDFNHIHHGRIGKYRICYSGDYAQTVEKYKDNILYTNFELITDALLEMKEIIA